jgi:hypothetical protein
MVDSRLGYGSLKLFGLISLFCEGMSFFDGRMVVFFSLMTIAIFVSDQNKMSTV